MKTPRPDFAEIKKTTDIAGVIESYGIELKPSSRGDLKGLCPFHDDSKPSMVVTPGKGLFHCMACGAAGNVIQFVAKKEGIAEKEAALRLLDTVPGVGRGSEMTAKGKKPTAATKPAPEVDPLADPELFAAILEHYHEALFGTNKSGMNYLSGRRLADVPALQHFKVGLVDGTLKEKLSASQLEKAKLLGLVNAKGNEKFYGRVVIPIFESGPDGQSNGSAVGLYGRDITGKSEVKHLYLAGGHRAVWNAQAATVYPDELICAESIFDALAIWIHGRKKNVIAAYGARGWTPHHRELIEKPGTKKLVFAFDADETGQERARELATELTQKLDLPCHRIKWPDHAKDANGYFLYNAEADFKGDRKSFLPLLESAPRIGFKKSESSKLTLLEQTEDAAIFQNGSVSYKVRGGMGGIGNGANMKVIVTASAGENHGAATRSHTDRLDLYASRSRKNFSATAAWRLELDAEKIEAHLLELLDQLEKLRETTAQATEVREEMSEAQRTAALKLLNSPDFFDTLSKHIEAIGYVGEDRNKKLTYVICSSRRLPKPLSGIVRSQSGAGKSYLMECVAELMPPEDVHFFSRLTPQALYYLERDALQHKLLIVDERNGSEESEYPIRTLQTRKVLKLAVPVKDPNSGRIKTETLEILGPISYMESTTSQKVNPENENRCFEIYLDESDSQTRAIFAAQRKSRTLEGWKVERLKEKVRTLHQTARIARNPAEIIVLPRHPKLIPPVLLKSREMKKLLEAPDLGNPLGFRDRTIMEVFFATGMRLSELISSAVEDLNFEENLIHIKHGKGQKQRLVPMGQAARNWLHEYLQNVRPILTKSGAGLAESDTTAVFLNRFARRIDKNGWQKKLTEYVKAAGICKNFTTHCFRHQLATSMLERGADTRHIQEILGHETLKTTQRYLHVVKAELKRIHAKSHPRESAPVAPINYGRHRR